METVANASNQTESSIIERIVAGEKDLFYPLVRPYERAVYSAAYAVLRNEADAEDAAQEAMVKAFQHLAGFRRESKFSTWLIQIAINESRMKLRKNRPQLYESVDEGRQTSDGEYIPRDFADWREIPSEQLNRKQLRQAIQKALSSLGAIYREVFVLRDMQEMSIAETAKALGITEASVKTRLLRARLQLRDALAPGLDGGWNFGEGHWQKVRPW